MVPAGVGPAFEVIETECVFEFSVVLLDAPAQLPEADQISQGRVGGQVR